MTKKELVYLWNETQIGNIYKCKEKQIEFSEAIWELYYLYENELLIKLPDKCYHSSYKGRR